MHACTPCLAGPAASGHSPAGSLETDQQSKLHALSCLAQARTRSSTCCRAARTIVYFAGAVWAAGSAIASGLFVPMLLIGSCVGRIVGLIAVDIAAASGYGSQGCAALLEFFQAAPGVCMRLVQAQLPDVGVCSKHACPAFLPTQLGLTACYVRYVHSCAVDSLS